MQTSQEYRRAKLQQLIDEQYGGVAARLSEACGISCSTLSQYRGRAKTVRPITVEFIDKVDKASRGWCAIEAHDPSVQSEFTFGLLANINLLESKVNTATRKLALMLSMLPTDSTIFDEIRWIEKSIADFKAAYSAADKKA